MPKLPSADTINRDVPQNAYRAQGYQGGIAEAGQLDAANIAARGGAQLAATSERLGTEFLENKQRLDYATATQDFIQKKNDIDAKYATDRDYTTLPDRYQADLSQALQQSSQGIGGGAARAQFQASMGIHSARSVGEIRTKSIGMAKDADRGWLTDFVDNGIKNALSSGDEGTRAASFNSINESITSMETKGSISSVEASKLRKSVPEQYGNRRAVMLMDSNPQGAYDALKPQGLTETGDPLFTKTNDWRDFIEPSKRMEFVRMAQTRAAENSRADEIEQLRKQRISDLAKSQAAEKVSNTWVSNLISDPTKNDPKTLVNDPNLKPHEKWGLYQMQQAALGGEGRDTKTYGPGFYAAYQAIHAPDGDPNRITDPATLYSRVGPHKDPTTGEMVPGDLTVSGVDKLTQEITGRRTPEGEAEVTMKKTVLDAAHKEISGTNSLLNLRDPKGDQNYLKFLAEALPAYDKGRKEGKSAIQLLNPDSPDYIGKSVKNYKRPMNEWMKDMLEANAPNASGTEQGINLGTQESIVSAYRDGKISREDATAALIKGGFATAPSAAPAPVQTEPAPIAPTGR